MRLVFRRAAEKALDRVQSDRRRQIVSRLRMLAADLTSRNADVRHLAGSSHSRLRIGEYRVLFSRDDAEEELIVHLIRTLGDVYKR